MRIHISFVLLLSSGAVCGGLEKVLRQAEFIADIYQQFPHSCIFIIHCESQQQDEDQFCIIYSSCVLLLNRNMLTETLRVYACDLLHQTRKFYLELYCFNRWEKNKTWNCEI